MPWSCVCGARGRSVGLGPVPVVASPSGLLTALGSLAVRFAGYPARVPLPYACRYAIPCGLCVPRARSGCSLGPRRVFVVCVCALVLPQRTRLPPPRVGVARALRAVLLQGAGRDVPGGLCPSAFSSPVPCSAYLAFRGMTTSLPPLAWHRVARPPAGRPVFVSWLCALWGQHEGARGGGASRLGVGRPGSGAVPRPTARPWGVRPGPAMHWLRGRGMWAMGPVTKPTARALVSWLCALWGRHKGALGGASLAWVWGVRGWALTHARPPVLRACGQGSLPTGCVCGGCGRGDPPPIPERALLQAGFARCGAARGRPGQGAAGLGVGCPGLGAPLRPAARP